MSDYPPLQDRPSQALAFPWVMFVVPSTYLPNPGVDGVEHLFCHYHTPTFLFNPTLLSTTKTLPAMLAKLALLGTRGRLVLYACLSPSVPVYIPYLLPAAFFLLLPVCHHTFLPAGMLLCLACLPPATAAACHLYGTLTTLCTLPAYIPACVGGGGATCHALYACLLLFFPTLPLCISLTHTRHACLPCLLSPIPVYYHSYSFFSSFLACHEQHVCFWHGKKQRWAFCWHAFCYTFCPTTTLYAFADQLVLLLDTFLYLPWFPSFWIWFLVGSSSLPSSHIILTALLLSPLISSSPLTGF